MDLEVIAIKKYSTFPKFQCWNLTIKCSLVPYPGRGAVDIFYNRVGTHLETCACGLVPDQIKCNNKKKIFCFNLSLWHELLFSRDLLRLLIESFLLLMLPPQRPF